MKATIKITDEIIAIPGDKIKFKFDYNKSELVRYLEDNYVTDPKEIKEQMKRSEYYKEFCRKKEDLLPYNGMTLIGKFISYSRIDKSPIVEIDWDLAGIRDKKINKILKKQHLYKRRGLLIDNSSMHSLLE